MPVEEDLGQAYAKYYTHGEAATGHSWLTSVMRRRGQVLRSLLNPARRERDSLLLMDLSRIVPGKLLDVGCGDGTRIAQLQKLGWDVYGQDLDPAAVGYARETLGLQAFLGPLENVPFAENTFDCVTLNHVIEHVHHPIDLLEKSRRFLKPGGRLVVITPNLESFAHQHFGPVWRGLEPPRHLHLFSLRTLSTAVLTAGFSGISSLRTSVGNAQVFAQGSLAVKNEGQVSGVRSIWPLANFTASVFSTTVIFSIGRTPIPAKKSCSTPCASHAHQRHHARRNLLPVVRGGL